MEEEKHLGGYVPGGDVWTWFPNLWTWFVKKFKIRSVLDLGCGEGHSTKFFYGLGCDVLGIEGSRQAIINSAIPDKIIRHDFCNGPYIPEKIYDLIWCCEFVEHVEEKYLFNFLKTFESCKYLMITHATLGQGGYHHVNEQSVVYWLKYIEDAGFELLPKITLLAREKAANYFFLRSGLVFINKKRFPDYTGS
ncbi:MAG: class I SAM-dependent methyltransferase [Patescibacteria group bacterium]